MNQLKFKPNPSWLVLLSLICSQVNAIAISTGTIGPNSVQKLPTLPTIEIGCSGLVKLPLKGDTILLDFKLNPNQTDHNCLWSLDPSSKNQYVTAKLKLTVLNKNPTQTNSRHGNKLLTFTEWYFRGIYKDLNTHVIDSSNGYSTENWINGGFLSFNSQGSGSSKDDGFLLRVDVMDRDADWDGSASSASYTSSSGSYAYSYPSAYDYTSVVISPQPAHANFTLTVNFVDSRGNSDPCDHYDSVDILEFGRSGVPKELGRQCGHLSAVSYTTEYPILALFYWQRVSGKGVQLSWK